MRASEYLRATQEQIRDPEHWTQGRSFEGRIRHAVTKERFSLPMAAEIASPGVEHYTAYCAVGAFQHTANTLAKPIERVEACARVDMPAWIFLATAAKRWMADHHLAETDGRSCLVYINDSVGHAAVMEVFAAAIELAVEIEMDIEAAAMKEDACPFDAGLDSTIGAGTEPATVALVS